MDEDRVNLDLRATPRAPGRARRELDRLDRWLEPETVDNIHLLVNELVTNSVKFAGGGNIQVRLARRKGAGIRVEVLDDGPGFVPTGETPALTDTGGRGLFLVEALSDRWGVSRDDRTCVWFEIDPEEARAS